MDNTKRVRPNHLFKAQYGLVRKGLSIWREREREASLISSPSKEYFRRRRRKQKMANKLIGEMGLHTKISNIFAARNIITAKVFLYILR